MTTALAHDAAPTTQLLRHRTLSLRRAVAVEARKLVDTRTGPILIGVAALASGTLAGGRALFSDGTTPTLGLLADLATMPASMIATVLGILLVAGEYTARTASVTFALDPRRGRVLTAKALAIVALGFVATVLSYAAAALVALVAPLVTGHPVAWTAAPSGIATIAGSVMFSVLAGFALALALRNAVGPIVLLLVWPTVALLTGSMSEAAREVLGYVDVDPVFGLTDGTANGVAKLATSAVLWILVPLTIGLWRTLRRDVP